MESEDEKNEKVKCNTIDFFFRPGILFRLCYRPPLIFCRCWRYCFVLWWESVSNQSKIPVGDAGDERNLFLLRIRKFCGPLCFFFCHNFRSLLLVTEWCVISNGKMKLARRGWVFTFKNIARCCMSSSVTFKSIRFGLKTGSEDIL